MKLPIRKSLYWLFCIIRFALYYIPVQFYYGNCNYVLIIITSQLTIRPINIIIT